MENGVKPVVAAVDDQPAILHRVISILKGIYQVMPFTSGQTALDYIEEKPVDLVLLDYLMPGMSGVEVLDKLQAVKKTRNIPVIFLTGSESGDTEADVLERGASDYIRKPIREQVLLTRVRMQVELSRYRERMEYLVEEKTKKIKIRENIALNLLARATDMRDHETGGHIVRTTEMVRIMVQDLLNCGKEGYSLTKLQAEDISESAKLHDLGKIAIPDEILLKREKLAPDEFEIVKQHPLHSAGILDEYAGKSGGDSFLRTARDIALYHHEHWNGNGYPHGLKGEEIPLAARIAAIADVYDTITSERPYRTQHNHKKAVEIITSESGSQFDPYLVSVFLRYEREFENIVIAMR